MWLFCQFKYSANPGCFILQITDDDVIIYQTRYAQCKEEGCGVLYPC